MTWLPPDNPFAARRVRPGAVPYFFTHADGLGTLLTRLRKTGGWGQIVGPHGSGKSTLVAALLPHLEAAGWSARLLVRHAGESALPAEVWRELRTEPVRLVVIDGYEQLSWWCRFRLRRLCRQCGHGLLATCHVDLGLPLLYRTQATETVARQVVEHLLGLGTALVIPAEVDGPLAARGGNLREALFDLYDLHERRRRAFVVRSP